MLSSFEIEIAAKTFKIGLYLQIEFWLYQLQAGALFHVSHGVGSHVGTHTVHDIPLYVG